LLEGSPSPSSPSRVPYLVAVAAYLDVCLNAPCVAMANDLSFLPGTPQTRCGACLCGSRR
jgi:hypothetical protein